MVEPLGSVEEDGGEGEVSGIGDGLKRFEAQTGGGGEGGERFVVVCAVGSGKSVGSVPTVKAADKATLQGAEAAQEAIEQGKGMASVGRDEYKGAAGAQQARDFGDVSAGTWQVFEQPAGIDKVEAARGKG